MRLQEREGEGSRRRTMARIAQAKRREIIKGGGSLGRPGV